MLGSGFGRLAGEVLFWLRGGTLVAAAVAWAISWPVIFGRPLRRWNAYIGWYGWTLNVASTLIFVLVAALPLVFAIPGNSVLPGPTPAPRIP